MTKDNLKETLDGALALTENGALGFRTTGKELLDLNFATSSLRNETEEEIVRRFTKAYYENPRLALKWLFFCRDCRGGMGERRTFRTILKWLATSHVDEAKALVGLVAEYGRVDDLLPLLETPAKDAVVAYVMDQLAKDLAAQAAGRPISLLAKWLPSCNTSSAEARQAASVLCKALGLTEREYRKTLAKLRAYLKVVETKMSGGQWGEIDYETVPSRAAILYRKAFHRHDEKRHQAYLDALTTGEAKINASVSFPHDIVEAYYAQTGKKGEVSDGPNTWTTNIVSLQTYDQTLEAMWTALPEYVPGCSPNTICVVDMSASMGDCIGGMSLAAWMAAEALALYFAERLSGPFRNAFLTFGDRPELVDVSRGKSLHDKLELLGGCDESSSTDIAATFRLILDTAVRHRLSQKDLPKNVLVLSDMEFDSGCRYDQTLFEEIAGGFAAHGYKLPRLVFWNLNARTGTVPVQTNRRGVALVSGFSPAIAKMVLADEVDPYECLVRQLNAPRYAAIDRALDRSAA